MLVFFFFNIWRLYAILSLYRIDINKSRTWIRAVNNSIFILLSKFWPKLREKTLRAAALINVLTVINAWETPLMFPLKVVDPLLCIEFLIVVLEQN